MKQVTIVPQGGLCNRLRVVLSALTLSRPDVSLRVDWACNAECRASFADLFATAPLTPLLIGDRRWWNVPQSRRNLHLPALLRRACYDLQLVNFNGATDSCLPRLIDTYNIYMCPRAMSSSHIPPISRNFCTPSPLCSSASTTSAVRSRIGSWAFTFAVPTACAP